MTLAAPDRPTTQKDLVTVLRALLCAASMMLQWTVAPALAQDAAPAQTDAVEPGGAGHASPMNENGAGAQRQAEAAPETDARELLCLMIDICRAGEYLPLEFFVRVIWQESRFQPNAVGPVTRNGQRAEGIAQFMPDTASERRLLDPFDPVQALPKSAEFLSELRHQFGNLGLAAAAYNAGPRAGAGLARRLRRYAAGNPQLRCSYYGAERRDWALASEKGRCQIPHRRSNCRDLTGVA